MTHASFRKRPKTYGHDDMVMLLKASDKAIHDNLETRYKNDIIYHYIGEVLIAVNPYKMFPDQYNDKKIDEYQGIQMSENPPHIFAIGDDMYRNLLVDKEHQCVIISGESGAGKTVNAKFIMEYLSKISGGIGDIERVKQIILSTNPLLEAFGNAKTLRNNNSSRFGKYFNINFDHGGRPVGGTISNFLLEKTRVSGVQYGERNFHIFYMIMAGLADQKVADQYGLQGGPESFNYTGMSGDPVAEGIDDLKEFYDMEVALKTINITEQQIVTIYQILAGILFLGNIMFEEDDRGVAFITDENALHNSARLLGVDSVKLKHCLTTCKMRMTREVLTKTFNPVQANQARDSLAQGIYTRMFDFFVAQINTTLEVKIKGQTLNCGVLDIYGFEIFDNNGFEQLCINFVNEKLQQIFIELTLKSEQEEYRREKIQWTDIKYFNNKEICDIIEMKIPQPGIFYLLDDMSRQANAMEPGKVDSQIHGVVTKRLSGQIIQDVGQGMFCIQHYAGQVTYNCQGFFEKNRDTLFEDMVLSLKSSAIPFMRDLFDNEKDNLTANPDLQSKTGRNPKKIESAGMKIKKQANKLVDELMKCRPHYVRCIKPNENKKPGDWNSRRVEHQVKYLGLSENIRVRRAGFAYRRPFDKFLQRYNILQYINDPSKAVPPMKYDQNPREGQAAIQRIMEFTGMGPPGDNWQFGVSKLFVKAPESVNMLEDKREWIYDSFARCCQKHIRNHLNRIKSAQIKEDSSRVVFKRKDRSRVSINRRYFGDYIGLEQNPQYRSFTRKREAILFAAHVKKYDSKMNPMQRTLILTSKNIQILGYERVDQNNAKTKDQSVELVVKFQKDLDSLREVYVSTLQDGFCMFKDTWSDEKDPSRVDIMISTEYLTEFLYLLTTRTVIKGLQPIFTDNWTMMTARPVGFFGKFKKLPREINFKDVNHSNSKDKPWVKKVSKYSYDVLVLTGLPKDSRPKAQGGFMTDFSQKTGYSVKVNRESQVFGLQVHNSVEKHSGGDIYDEVPGEVKIPYRQTSLKQTGHSGSVAVRHKQTHGLRQNQFKASPQTQNAPTNFAASNLLDDAMNGLMEQVSNIQTVGNSGFQVHNSSTTNARPKDSGPTDSVFQTHNSGFRKGGTVQTADQTPRSGFQLGGMYSSPGNMQHQLENHQNKFNNQDVKQQPNASDPVQLHQIPNNGFQMLNTGQMHLNAQMYQTGQMHQPSQMQPPKPRPKPKPKPKRNNCKALYDYEAQDNDELRLQIGDVIQILEETAGGWWKGKLNGTIGLFPGNYVEKI